MVTAFLKGETVEAVWWLYIKIWTNNYMGHAEGMQAGQGREVMAAAWAALV